jgi:hypothetical protein
VRWNTLAAAAKPGATTHRVGTTELRDRLMESQKPSRMIYQ